MKRGVTIVEVLFAILIATVGILAVFAIFPFAANQAKRARVNDMLASAGRSAFHDFDVRGMRRQDRWLACNPATGFIVPATTVLQNGESVCIDPRMMAAHITTGALNSGNPPLWPINCVQQMQPLVSATGTPGGQCVQAFPYLAPGAVPVGVYMRRITLWSGATNAAGNRLAMTLAQASSIFLKEDDLSYQRPKGPSTEYPNETNTSGARQDATIIYGSQPKQGEILRRESERKLSWIATLVPLANVDPSTLTILPTDEYALSVVMLHERPNDLQNLDLSPPMKERRLFGIVVRSDNGGIGEIQIFSPFPDQLKLRPGQWFCQSGTYGPLTRFLWYRVIECDKEPEPVTGSSPAMFSVNASIAGQEWPQDFICNTPSPVTLRKDSTGKLIDLPVNVDVIEGAAAVYEKTIRLEYGSSM